MVFRKVLALRGPNLWAYFPVIEAWVDLGIWKDRPSTSIPGFNERLMSWLPGMIEHRCSIGERGGFFQRLRDGTYMAHILEHVTIELQGLTGVKAGYGRARETSEEGVYRVVFRYADETLARECLEQARLLVMAAAEERDLDVAPIIERLREMGRRLLPSESTNLIMKAARDRKIPFLRLESGDINQLGYGAKQRRTMGAADERSGAIALSLAEDPEMAESLLELAGVPYAADAGSGRRYNLLLAGGRLVAAAVHDSAWRDVTDSVHPEVIARALDAARVLGLETAGVEIMADDIGLPLEHEAGVVKAITGNPDLSIYAHADGVKADVAGAVLAALFPPGEDGRIPIAAVTGTNGKTTVARFLAHVLEGAGRTVGLTCTDGIYISGRRIEKGDCSGPSSARRLLMNRHVEAAVFETARGGILRAGVAFDECLVGVVTNVGEGDHLGISDVLTPEEIARVKRTIVEVVSERGTAVLNAEDALVAAMASHCRGTVMFFALDRHHPVLAAHAQSGGQVIFLRDGTVMIASAGQEHAITSLDRVPMTHGGRVRFQVENALAAIGAAWAMGLPIDRIAERAATFHAGMEQDPARFNVFDIGGAKVIVDFGHNPDALRAVVAALAAFPASRRLAVFSASGDRRDTDIVTMGALLGDAFDHVILYEDNDRYDRPPGEITSLLKQGIAKGTRVSTIEEMEGGLNAMRHGISAVRPGELLMAQAHLADPAAEFFRSSPNRSVPAAG